MDDEDKKAVNRYPSRTYSYRAMSVEDLDRQRSLELVEKLLRELDVCDVWLDSDNTVSLSYWVGGKEDEQWSSTGGTSLVDAYNKLKTGVRE